MRRRKRKIAYCFRALFGNDGDACFLNQLCDLLFCVGLIAFLFLCFIRFVNRLRRRADFVYSLDSQVRLFAQTIRFFGRLKGQFFRELRFGSQYFGLLRRLCRFLRRDRSSLRRPVSFLFRASGKLLRASGRFRCTGSGVKRQLIVAVRLRAVPRRLLRLFGGAFGLLGKLLRRLSSQPRRFQRRDDSRLLHRCALFDNQRFFLRSRRQRTLLCLPGCQDLFLRIGDRDPNGSKGEALRRDQQRRDRTAQREAANIIHRSIPLHHVITSFIHSAGACGQIIYTLPRKRSQTDILRAIIQNKIYHIFICNASVHAYFKPYFLLVNGSCSVFAAPFSCRHFFAGVSEGNNA